MVTIHAKSNVKFAHLSTLARCPKQLLGSLNYKLGSKLSHLSSLG